MNKVFLWLGPLLLALAACAPEQQAQPSPTQAQQYTVLMDVPSPEGQNLEISTYFPAVVQARPGDTLVFENQSSQAPHTITFGVAPDRSDAPSPVTADGQFNPVAFEPCFTDQAPTATLSSCPQQPGGQPPAFDGRGLWTSGIVSPDVAGTPAGGPPTSVQVKLDDTIAPGRYSYVCLLHPFMGGAVEVVDRAAPVPSPAQVAQASKEAQAQVVTEATALKEPETGGGATVNAGWGDKVTAVNRFGPAKLTVPAGTAVTWKSHSPYEPHTITFGQPPFTGLEDPAMLRPGGVSPGGQYSGGFAHSGFIGAAPFPTDTYSLTFTKPGTYQYVCLLHPDMAGIVEVT